MSTTIIREMRFEAAHFLPKTPEGHKCRRLHGHSYVIEIHVTGEVDPETGWVCDFDELRQAFLPLRVQLDHHTLNEVGGLENPTSEVLAGWLWERMILLLPGLTAVVVHETCTSRCVYTGP
ncbi:MAG: 6-carboxytetrahydropterin synthase QueD [Deltaproteobacteria bacterium RIFOXYA12_FULL_58_15]|nr:MAG: 6-carboxytetrahydropterin synthase QueD [Deltaproteobacteria bacterium RIFOXYA12_FULL_58_15]OGR13884.1 MAG: 6-carboxytetrahydropterin synthase QueD [Deltaproteobacteria bacterium RIFOXYB12_FULL_58_9]